MTVTKVKKFVPGEEVILDCNVKITSHHTVSWLFENTVIWTGDKLNKMSNNSLRYEITEKMNLRIKNTSIDDEGKYTCLLSPSSIDGKYTVKLESKPIEEQNNQNSSHLLQSDAQNNKTTVHTTPTETTDQILNAEVKTNLNEERNNVKNTSELNHLNSFYKYVSELLINIASDASNKTFCSI
ncbi:CNTN2 [Mytilus coruscus]|uniref:CNTN2 n=1 Tax=Mytilus coruscus TaxID=42192 RepID=A0A6J8DTR4_MYTCO|nr:CNTN2 [Mytilus coruscus]